MKITQEECLNRFKATHGDKYIYDKVNYTNLNNSVLIGCDKHKDIEWLTKDDNGIFWFSITPKSHWNGFGCKVCSGNYVPTLEEAIKRANIANNYEYDYSAISEYINHDTKVKIIHKDHYFYQNFRLQWKGEGCPICYGTPKKTTEQFILDANKKFPNSDFDYSKVVYQTNSKPVLIGCRKHKGDPKADTNGIYWFNKSPNAFLSHINGCPRCSPSFRMDTEDFIWKAKKIHGNLFDYSNVNYINIRTKVDIVCSIHGNFLQLPSKHLAGQGCPFCAQSKGERRIAAILDEIGIFYMQQYFYEDLLDINYLKYDFYIPELNTLIEYNGEQHYYPVAFNTEDDMVKEFELRRLHDNMKMDYAYKNKINLLIVPYWEYENIDKILYNEVKFLKREIA